MCRSQPPKGGGNMVPGLLHEGPDVGKISAHPCTAGISGVAGLAPQGGRGLAMEAVAVGWKMINCL